MILMKTKNKYFGLKEIELKFKKLFKSDSNFEIFKFVFKAHVGSILILIMVGTFLPLLLMFFKHAHRISVFNIMLPIFFSFSIIFWIFNRTLNIIIKRRVNVSDKNQRIKELLEEMQNKLIFKFCVKVYDVIISKRIFWFIGAIIIIDLIPVILRILI